MGDLNVSFLIDCLLRHFGLNSEQEPGRSFASRLLENFPVASNLYLRQLKFLTVQLITFVNVDDKVAFAEAYKTLKSYSSPDLLSSCFVFLNKVFFQFHIYSIFLFNNWLSVLAVSLPQHVAKAIASCKFFIEWKQFITNCSYPKFVVEYNCLMRKVFRKKDKPFNLDYRLFRSTMDHPPTDIIKMDTFEYDTPADQDAQLVQDMLYCMQGSDGETVSYSICTSPVNHCELHIAPFYGAVLREQAKRFAPLLYDSHQLRTMSPVTIDKGNIYRAFVEAVEEMLMRHMRHIIEWRRLAAAGELTLSTLWSYVQPTLKVFRTVQEIRVEIENLNIRGGAILSLIYNKVKMHDGNLAMLDMLLSLLSKVAKPYFRMLNQWFRTGTFADPYNEFMIRLGSQSRYLIDRDRFKPNLIKDIFLISKMIPQFLSPIAEKILNAGKFLIILRSSENFKPTQELPCLEFSMDSSKYVRQVETLWLNTSRQTVKYLIEEGKLLDRCMLLRHLFFLSRGDWLLDFVDVAGADLALDLEEIEPDRLESLFYFALRGSTTGYLLTDEDNKFVCFSCILLTKVILSFAIFLLFPFRISIKFRSMEQCLSAMKECTSAFSIQSLDEDDVKAYEALVIQYEPEWPISLVFTPLVIAKCEMLFHWLMICKLVESQLTKCFVYRLDERCGRPLFRKMLYFVRSLMSLMVSAVVHPLWHEFLDAVRGGQLTFENLCERINGVLDCCSKYCFTADLPLTQCIRRLLRYCLEFYQIVQRGDACEQETRNLLEKNFESDFIQFSSRLKEMLNDKDEDLFGAAVRRFAVELFNQ
ncbi:Gamma-tubulin complex component 2 [Trichinella spiralis]|uniref:Gamma-tubulin complex component n=1 Tax=Trichinella spiralis TaxID=6334 RepID=A0A0V1BGL5_TRISP|nr:Gamma-tubulin complex component 2 [Trichinella spiralis]